ncbi:hypothetical protein K3495_g11515 [Podosphaera aphanis]|nr:hypothetical protein K3495_g11515 [Podosphaera aphanis]
MTQGLYVVTHITQGYEEKAFTTVENGMKMKDSSSLEINYSSVQDSDNDVVRKHERDWVIPIKTKSDAYEALKAWKVITEHRTEKKVKTARSDNAPELLKAIHDWKVEDGIQAQSTTIASSHQNGPAERSIKTLDFDMRAMLEETQILIDFWDEAAEADSYMRNRTETGPTISNEKTSSMKAFTG